MSTICLLGNTSLDDALTRCRINYKVVGSRRQFRDNGRLQLATKFLLVQWRSIIAHTASHLTCDYKHTNLSARIRRRRSLLYVKHTYPHCLVVKAAAVVASSPEIVPSRVCADFLKPFSDVTVRPFQHIRFCLPKTILQSGLRLSFSLQPLLLFPNLGRKEGFKRTLLTAGFIIIVSVGIVNFFEEGENSLFCTDE